MTLLRVIGNSHVWGICGWEEFAARDSVPLPTSWGDLRVCGIAVTGGTAHNLREPKSSTQAGHTIREFLRESEPGPTLAVFGDVDVRFHLGTDRSRLGETVARYCDFLRTLRADGLLGQDPLVVSSITGAHSVLEPHLETCDLWDALMEGACRAHGWHFVDLRTPFVDVPAVDGNNHLGGAEVRATVMARVREALTSSELAAGAQS